MQCFTIEWLGNGYTIRFLGLFVKDLARDVTYAYDPLLVRSMHCMGHRPILL